MLDPTPPPLGTVTRRWTGLTDSQRDHEIRRLLDGGCVTPAPAHVDRPAVDGGDCYRPLVPAALDGDPVALGWLATTHRPLLVVRGRALLDHDPAEWGATCLEVLHTALVRADLAAGRWVRRRVAQQIASQLTRTVAAFVAYRRHERPTAPELLYAPRREACVAGWDPHPELTAALDRTLGRLDTATHDALCALADQQPLVEIADRHGLSHAAVRQRVVRARQRLQPQLATYQRPARR